MKKTGTLLLIIIILGIVSCEKNELCPYENGCDPIQNTSESDTSIVDTIPLVDTANARRNILIEDFTGHTCGNCPAAAITARQIRNTYGDQIIITAVHAGFFATPKAGPQYATDFTTTAGEAYNSTFGNEVAGNPNGFVSRSKVISNTMIIQPNNWETAVLALKDKKPDVVMNIEVDYDNITNEIDVQVHSFFMNSLSGDYKLVLYFQEDSIIDWQKDYSQPSTEQDVQDYVHQHVLRDNINGTWGDDVVSGSINANEIVSKSYAYSPDSNWKINHCAIVAFIYNSTTYEILQVTEAHITE